MIFTKSAIPDVLIIEPTPRGDTRGYFARVFAKEELEKVGVSYDIVHVNRSMTEEKGTIRGMHCQIAPKEEDKIVQCLSGSIFDVALDLREGSPTYGKWVGEILSAENKKMFLIPKGFAHGFQTLEENTLVEYFVSEYYAPECEIGIRWNDPFHEIKWPLQDVQVSEKDGKWPDFKK
ncbi:MAG: dTDP-4-dehydrorhamnose 3,5-epimerase [Candidatus Levybacteria bacterium CG10_big_fil_rev_8_21_14_0_10_36_7]|nr:MAG: dTDP-4-dehydrorhamnose 3,5-epimerase [Candidatus Levybacteria bacterium CG10_big_fil_rev_8_21_14_0_10_36_7]